MDSSSARSLTGSDLHSLVLKDTRNPFAHGKSEVVFVMVANHCRRKREAG